jgi:hypothetical protein
MEHFFRHLARRKRSKCHKGAAHTYADNQQVETTQGIYARTQAGFDSRHDRISFGETVAVEKCLFGEVRALADSPTILIYTVWIKAQLQVSENC